jgi:DNA polymerase-3 subunit alpha
MGFISYGFNKSHAIAYAYNSYSCAWLYTYFPIQWIKACLEKDANKQKTIVTVRKLGYNVSKVDINLSKATEWNFVDNSWLPPLNSLKGIGDVGAYELLERKGDGFTTFENFFFNAAGVWRWNKLNKKCLEALIKTESFQSLNCVGPDKVFKNYRHLYEFMLADTKIFDKIKKGKIKLDEALLIDVPDWTLGDKIVIQNELIGFYDKSPLIEKYINFLNEYGIDAIDEQKSGYEIEGEEETEEFSKNKVWCIVEGVEEKTTKNGKLYYNITVSGISNKTYTFKAWIKPTQISLFKPANVVILSLGYEPQWGFSLNKSFKWFGVNKKENDIT